jgi:hypothetical protein
MVRLIWYAIVVGLASNVAQHEWVNHGLDDNGQFDDLRAQAPFYIGLAVLVLAAFSRLWRSAGVLLLGVLVGVVVTAPLAIAHALGQ